MWLLLCAYMSALISPCKDHRHVGLRRVHKTIVLAFIPVTTASRLTLDDTQDQDTKQGMLFALGFSIHSGALISAASPGGGGPSTGGLLNLPNNLLV